MTNIYEISTWSNKPEWKQANDIATAAAKRHNGNIWTVAIGEWGVRTFIVLVETKEEARKLAIAIAGDEKVKVRNVTNCKKYS